MTGRPYFDYGITELEALFTENQSNSVVLAALAFELGKRTTNRAGRLYSWVTKAAKAIAVNDFNVAKSRNVPEVSLGGAPSETPLNDQAEQPHSRRNAATEQPVATITSDIGSGDVPPAPSFENADDPQAILSTWIALEALSPQTYRRPEDLAAGDRRCIAQLSEMLPWQSGEHFAPNRRLFYQIVLGSIRMNTAMEELVKAFGQDEEFNSRLREEAAIAAILVDQNGVPADENSIAVSSFAWALPQALRLQLGDLGAWPSIEPKIIEKLEEMIRRVDDDGAPLPLDWETINAAYGWLVEQFGLPGHMIEPPKFALRVYHYYKAKKPPEPLLLNSFYIRDLSRSNRLLTAGSCPAGLRRYVGLDAPTNTADLLTDRVALERAVAPAMMPPVRWPSPGGYPLVLLQQAAVNLTRSELAGREGIIAVNGPPGTGKTTLLRDVVAACVFDRAVAMSMFDDPEKAFSASGQKVSYGGAFFHLYELDPRLKGHEMVVASSNNKAVENVSRELPAAKAVGRSRDELSYFRTIADRVHGPRDSNGEGEDAAPNTVETWGLIAAVLGNASNRFHFHQSFWWDADHGFRLYLKAAKGDNVVQEIKDPKTGEVLEYRTPAVVLDEKPPSPSTAKANWRRARERFLGLKQEVEDELRTLEVVRQLCRRLASLRFDLDEREARLKPLLSERAGAEAPVAELERQAAHAQGTCDLRRREATAHHATRPGFFSRVFRTRAWRQWSQAHAPYRRALEAADAVLQSARRELATAREALAALAAGIRRLEADMSSIRSQIETVSQEMEPHRGRLGDRMVDDAFFARGHGAWNLAAPWMPDGLHRKREELFVAAMALHRAFIDASAQKMLHNLGVLMDIFSNGSPQDEAKRKLLGDLWATLFLVVPVISTTFASVERMLGDLPKGSIGWLLIDEAGQALPQAAVGAVMRARRSIVVGDPLQIPPVVALPERLNAEICRFFHVGKPLWTAPEASVQTLADRASAFQAVFRSEQGGRRVGIPLLVHRRCQEPMFGISNRIAYDEQMVHAPTACSDNEIEQIIGPSAWFDICGNADSKWCPAEGDLVVELLQHLAEARVTEPDLFIITPFRIVAHELRRRLERETRLFAALNIDVRKWVDARIGTIHTVQGREADSVMLVLGAPRAAQHGARSWAAGTPNIFNVAVSRAKRNLYVIGSYGSWSGVGYAQEVAKIPRRPLGHDSLK